MEARKQRALQLQSTPEYLDSLYLASKSGPNMANIRDYWNKKNEVAEEQTAAAVENAKEESRTVIANALEHIFKKISKASIINGTREELGLIVNELVPNPPMFASDEKLVPKTAEGLIGAGWWLSWLNNNDSTLNLTTDAKTIYEKALKKSDNDVQVAYESAVFYLLQTEHYDKAQEQADRAVVLLNGNIESKVLPQTLALLALANEKAGIGKEGNGRIHETINAALQNPDLPAQEKQSLQHLQENPQTIIQAFAKELPTAPRELQKKFEAVLEGVVIVEG